jgi:predicted CXXCH cytochrome family protein
MKRFLRLFIAAMLGFVLATFAQAASDVTNTVHNLSVSSPDFLLASTETQICIFCHTPHGGSLDGPLWNRDIGSVTSTFTFYSSSTTSATVNSVAAVSTESMLCLSCHDGSVSVYEMLNYSSLGAPVSDATADPAVKVGYRPGDNPAIGANSDGSTIGGQLGDDHPISFSYDAVLTDYIAALKAGDLHDVGSLPAQVRLFSPGNRVECSTCHNPHEATLPNFLVMSNAGSALCLGCHNK